MFHNFKSYTKEWDTLLSIGVKRIYKSGEIIYMQGEKDIGLICIMRGKVKNFMCFSNGTEKVTLLLEAPAIIGETAVIDNKGSIVSTQALTETEVIIVPAHSIRELLQQDPRFMMMLLEIFAAKIRSLEMQAESVVLNTQQRLARMLINFYSYGVFSQGADSNVLNITHDQLAGFLGTTRPKITSFLSGFESQGIIKRSRGTIEVLDEKALKEYYE